MYLPLAAALPLSPGLSAHRFRFDRFGSESGLLNQAIRSIVQSPQGFLWIGTGAGVFRFDGHRFQYFDGEKGLAPQSVQSLVVSPAGVIYAGSNLGVDVLENDHFRRLAVRGGPPPSPCGGSSCLAFTPSGKLLAALYDGLAILENGELRIFPETREMRLRNVSVEADGSIFLSTADAVYRAVLSPESKLTVQEIGTQLGLPRSELSVPVTDIQKRRWIRSRTELFVQLPGAAKFIRAGLSFPAVGAMAPIALDDKGQIWVPTYDGLWRCDETDRGFRWTRFGSANGMSADPVRTIFWDRFGTPWIGMERGGLSRWNGFPGWRSWQRADGLTNDEVTAFAVDTKNNLWIGTKDGLNTMDSASRIVNWRTRDGLASNSVRTLAATPDGAVWAGSNEGGLTRIGPDRGITRFSESHGLKNNRVISLTAEESGALWVCTRDGLYRADWRRANPGFEVYATPLTGRVRSIYRALRSADGSLWVANAAGLARQRDGAWRHYNVASGLPREDFVFMTERKPGELWLGYSGVAGIVRIEFDSRGDVRKTTGFGRGNGLRNGNISFVEKDAGGRIWVGTDEGVDIWSGEAWTHVGPAEGLIWQDVMIGGFLAHPDGRFFIGTALGFSEMRGPPAAPPPPTASIVGVSQKGVPIPAARWQRLSLPQGDVEVRFGNPRLLSDVQYRYRILRPGDDLKPADGWVLTGNPAVSLNLQPDEYQLQVEIDGSREDGGPRAASLDFVIEPHWSQTAGVRILLALGLGLGVYFGVRRMAAWERGKRAALEKAVGERTSELRAQAARIESQKSEIEALLDRARQDSRLKSEFLANMSHEIRTPMNGVIGMTSLALQTDLTVEQREYIETAKSSAESLLQILNDILDFSKIEAGRLDIESTPFFLRALIAASLRPFLPMAQAKHLLLTAEVDPSLPDAYCGDPTRIRQILSNLIGNSLKFTEHGTIALRVKPAASHTPDAPCLLFSVADSGIGIPAAALPVIFEQFRQADGSTSRKYGGTGLGLSICRRLASLMGGAMWAESVEGAGTTVSFTIALSSALASEPAGFRDLAPSSSECRLLLVEDNLVSQRVARRLLENRGHRVTVAVNGADAIELCRRQRFDLILMDMQLPGIDGLTATAAIRLMEMGERRRTPVIILTANAMKGDRERCLEGGADDYLTKPIDSALLYRKISQVLEKTPLRGAGLSSPDDPQAA